MFIFQVGPGIVFLLFDQTFLGRGVIMHCVTPVEPLLQCVTHTIFYQSNIPPVVPKFILKVECIQVQYSQWCSTIIFYDNYNTGLFTHNLCCHHLTLIYLSDKWIGSYTALFCCTWELSEAHLPFNTSTCFYVKVLSILHSYSNEHIRNNIGFSILLWQADWSNQGFNHQPYK